MIDGTEMFIKLWEFFNSVLQWGSDLWDFIVTTHVIGFNIELVDNPVFGWLVNWFIKFLNNFSFSINFLGAFTGGLILTLIIFFLIKSFIPLA